MKKLIDELHDSPLFVRMLEVGAGVPISSEIFAYPNASRTVYSTESYYAREAFDKAFGTTKHRAVSAERLKILVNESESINQDLSNGLYNTILSTTFQIGGIENVFSTHGWISLNIKGGSIRYYHISIHYPMERIEYIKKIGEIGIKLLHGQNKFIHENCFVDIVLDENLNPLYEETLEFISKNKISDIASVFMANGTIDRLEVITRNVDTLVVYKGSFNPPSISHQEIMTTCIDSYEENTKGVFCLSYNTYQKGKQTTASFLQRIKLLNLLGYGVIVLNKPLFKNTYDFLRLKYKNKIVFPQGLDTFNRMSIDYISFNLFETGFSIEKLKKDFKNTEFLVFKRDGEKLEIEIKNSELIKILDMTHKGVSSTKIRNLINQEKFEEVRNLLPKEIYNEVIKNKYN